MSLTPGTRLGPYEILAPLGAGGMGEVYRARDTALDREVAIKLLPDAFAHDAERLARFEREAKMLASLNHPNIAGIYGLSEHGGTRFLAMELVPGETLGDRIARGAIPLDEARRIALAIAEALEAAHDAGIGHRDLKPANVQLAPDGKVKVLDFGLAKIVESAHAVSGGSALNLSNSPTLTSPATMAGVILGTAAYMSPEQARGTPVDRRADIWAFGCVVYEMLTARRAFEGDTVSDTLASVLKSEPAWKLLDARAPRSVATVVERCLRKDPRRRAQSIGDVRIALEDATLDDAGAAVAGTAASSSQARATKGGRATRLVPWLVAGACAIALAATLSMPPRAERSNAERLRLSVNLLDAEDLTQELAPAAVLSPDGATIAFVAGFGQGQHLFLRRLDSFDARRVEGLEGVRSPFFSPDGAWIGIFTREALYKVPAGGGSPVRICDVREPRGATWSDDGSIVIAPHTETGLHRVPVDGGELTPITTLATATNERTHRWPFALPGGAILFMAQRRGETYDEADIDVWVPKSGEVKTLVRGGSAPRWSPTGHLLYVRHGDLLAAPFDLDRLEVTGPGVAVVEGVLAYTGDQTSGDGSAEYWVSGNGRLLYRANTEADRANVSRIVLVDRRGNVQRTISEPEGFSCPRVSPDGKRLAVCVSVDATTPPNLWIYDLERGTPTRLTFDRRSVTNIVWTPDGRDVLHTAEPSSVVARRADGIGGEHLLFEYGDDYTWPISFSPDGRTLALHSLSKTTNWDILLAPVSRDAGGKMKLGAFVPFANTAAIEWTPDISPDGAWVAYVSTESGRNEVYVQSITPGVAKWQVSWDGGNYPRWARSGSEILFQNGGAMLSARVERLESGLRIEKPVELFRGEFVDVTPFPGYDVTADGEGFILFQADDAAGIDRTHVTLVTNWFDELNRLAPGGEPVEVN
ncbi:MAG: protein kinase domain-containing protein [bacterium]